MEDDVSKLLVVDDEQKIREVIREYAEFNEFEVTEASDGMDAVALCKDNDYDIIIMDVMMPKLDGFSAVKEIKKTKDIPVIMLSARGEEYDKLFGFELGVDDYMTKPFSPKELMARVNVILTRRTPAVEESEKMTFDGLDINIPAREVTVDGERVELTPKEYDLLFYLVQNKNIALSRDKLLSDIWGYDFFGDDRTIDTHIKNLRNNLGPYRDKIITMRGIGYKFEA
jgi:DNA-binding response OmpR family regulator